MEEIRRIIVDIPNESDIFRVGKTSTKKTVMTYLRLKIHEISLSQTFLVKAGRFSILKIV